MDQETFVLAVMICSILKGEPVHPSIVEREYRTAQKRVTAYLQAASRKKAEKDQD